VSSWIHLFYTSARLPYPFLPPFGNHTLTRTSLAIFYLLSSRLVYLTPKPHHLETTSEHIAFSSSPSLLFLPLFSSSPSPLLYCEILEAGTSPEDQDVLLGLMFNYISRAQLVPPISLQLFPFVAWSRLKVVAFVCTQTTEGCVQADDCRRICPSPFLAGFTVLLPPPLSIGQCYSREPPLVYITPLRDSLIPSVPEFVGSSQRPPFCAPGGRFLSLRLSPLRGFFSRRSGPGDKKTGYICLSLISLFLISFNKWLFWALRGFC